MALTLALQIEDCLKSAEMLFLKKIKNTIFYTTIFFASCFFLYVFVKQRTVFIPGKKENAQDFIASVISTFLRKT